MIIFLLLFECSLLHTILATHEDPYFNPPMPYLAKVAENADDEVVWKLTAKDPQGLPLTYSLLSISPAGSPFTVLPNGHVKVGNNPNLNAATQASYTLQVCVANTIPITKCGTLTLQIVAGNLDPPSFDDLPDTANIAENRAIGSFVYTIRARDNDWGVTEPLTFTLLDSNPSPAPFTLDPNTGRVETTESFDYETLDTYTLDFMVYDGTFLAGPETLTVKVTDVNERPAFTGIPVLPVTVSEDQTGGQYALFTVTGTDPENDALAYSVACAQATCPFGVDATGLVYVDDSLGTLNYATFPKFDVTVRVSDGALTYSETLEIKVLDVNEAPVITSLAATATVTENVAPGAFLHKVVATDADGDTLYYYIQVRPQDGDSFTVNNLTGEIRHIANPGFDYESCSTYTINVYVSDGKIMSAVKSLTVNVVDVDEAPVIENLPLTTTVPESMAEASIIFSTYFTDQDAGNTHTISMAVTPASGAAKFTMDASGVISTVANPGFDYETLTSYTITVTVLDSTGLSDTGTLTVEISNRNEAPYLASNLVTVTVPEGQGAGTAVAGVTIAATDPDSDPLTYTLSGAGSGDFYLDGGPVLRYTSSIDYDVMVAPVVYVLAVTVSDPAGETDSMSINVIVSDQNDNTPTFSQASYSVSIDENMPALTSVVKVSASDGDSEYSGVTGAFTYTIDPTNTLANIYFNMDASTGVVYLKAPIDYEVYPSISFTVTAQDGGGLSSSVPVSVTVNDLNDSPPYFLPVGRAMFNFEVPEDAEVGWIVGVVEGADVDTVSYGVEYKLKQGSPFFSLDPSTGYITVTGSITPGRQYVMEVVVKDIGGLELESPSMIIRIDTFVPCEVLYNMQLLVPAKTLSSAASQEQLKSELDVAIQLGVARLVYIEEQRPLSFDGVAKQNDRTDVTVMFLSDTSTNLVANVGVVNKTYYSAADLQSVLALSTGGPSATLSSAVTTYPVITLEPWDPLFCVERPKYFWTETPGGLATLSLLAIAGLASLGALTGYLSYRIFFKQASGNFSMVQASRPPVPRAPAKNDATLQDFRYNPKDEAYTFRRTENQTKPGQKSDAGSTRTSTPLSARGVSPHFF